MGSHGGERGGIGGGAGIERRGRIVGGGSGEGGIRRGESGVGREWEGRGLEGGRSGKGDDKRALDKNSVIDRPHDWDEMYVTRRRRTVSEISSVVVFGSPPPRTCRLSREWHLYQNAR